jgi:hypothetical protein
VQVFYKIWKPQTAGGLAVCPDLSCDTFTFSLPFLILEYTYFKMSEVKVKVKLSVTGLNRSLPNFRHAQLNKRHALKIICLKIENLLEVITAFWIVTEYSLVDRH